MIDVRKHFHDKIEAFFFEDRPKDTVREELLNEWYDLVENDPTAKKQFSVEELVKLLNDTYALIGNAQEISRNHTTTSSGEKPPLPVVTLPQFLEQAGRVEWEAQDWLAKGGVTLLCGPPKIGKSLLCLQLALAKAAGGKFLGMDVSQRRVLMLLAEEGAPVIKQRLERMGEFASDNIFVHWGTLDFGDEQDIQRVRVLAQVTQADVLIIDPLVRFLGRVDENDAIKVSRCIYALRDMVSDLGMSAVVIHHVRKGGGLDGTAIRGSSAILAAADIAVVLRRQDGSDQESEENRVIAEFVSRLGSRQEQVLTLDPDRLLWSVKGALKDVDAQEKEAQIQEAIGKESITITQIQERTGMNLRTLRRHLAKMETTGQIEVQRPEKGQGGRGKETFYRQKTVTSDTLYREKKSVTVSEETHFQIEKQTVTPPKRDMSQFVEDEVKTLVRTEEKTVTMEEENNEEDNTVYEGDEDVAETVTSPRDTVFAETLTGTHSETVTLAFPYRGGTCVTVSGEGEEVHRAKEQHQWFMARLNSSGEQDDDDIPFCHRGRNQR